MRIALCQYSLRTEREANLAVAINLFHRAGDAGANLVIYPELCVSPFFPSSRRSGKCPAADSLDGDVVLRFRSACGERGTYAAPNLYLADNGDCFDASIIIDARGEIAGVSKMVHVPQMDGFFEQDYYTPSDTGFKVYPTRWGTVGVVICFDRHFPESIRTCAINGASLILIPTANRADEPLDVFECEIRAAAFQNCVFIAMCNRVGVEDDVVFGGESMVVNPDGCVIAKAGAEEQLVISDIDLLQASEARARRPYLSLRRKECFL
jgi:predicted amidohydrolase